MFRSVREAARRIGGASVVVTFDPYPVEVFRPERRGSRLLTPAQKRRLTLELGLDEMLELPFSWELARIPADRFVDEILLEHLDLREIYVGYDFRFGRDREGDASTLRRLGESRGFRTIEVPPVMDGDLPISSSRIRAALAEGDVSAAAAWLDRPYAVEGIVVTGRGEGARLLVPTANLRTDRRLLLPGGGVYVADVEWGSGRRQGVVNIGRRPTLTEDVESTVEVHLLDWEGDLRGETLQVHLLHRLRREIKFPSLEALREAIRADVASARGWLSAGGSEGPRRRG
jgi:riboflavin kinase/FMN adenylyltransferase